MKINKMSTTGVGIMKMTLNSGNFR